MAILRRISSRVRLDETTGFGTKTSMYGGRLVNKDGSANIRKTGLPFLDTLSWYHSMIHMPRWKFLFFIFLTYVLANLFFAILYFLIGVQYLGGMVETSRAGQFLEAFFILIINVRSRSFFCIEGNNYVES